MYIVSTPPDTVPSNCKTGWCSQQNCSRMDRNGITVRNGNKSTMLTNSYAKQQPQFLVSRCRTSQCLLKEAPIPRQQMHLRSVCSKESPIAKLTTRINTDVHHRSFCLFVSTTSESEPKPEQANQTRNDQECESKVNSPVS